MNSTASLPTVAPYRGFVLATDEVNGRDDSDFYAIVWDEATQSVIKIDDGTTRAYAPSVYHNADASPEIVAKATQWVLAHRLPALLRPRLERAKAKIGFGDTVRVVRGRKVKIGTEGEVSWTGANPYFRDYGAKYAPMGIRFFNPNSMRVGIRLADGSRVYTSMANVEKTNVPTVTDADLAEACRNAFHGNFAAVFHPMFALGCLMG